MRFSISAVLALATAVVAHVDFDSINKPASNEVIPAGSSYTVQWTTLAPQFKDSVVTVSLVGGETQNTQVVLDQVATGVKNSALSYTWTVTGKFPGHKVYGLKFTIDGTEEFSFSNPFVISGGSSSSTGTTTLVTSTGVKTISLSSTSSAPATTSSVHSTSSAVVISTSSLPCNTTTFATKPAQTTSQEIVSTTVVPASTTTHAVPTKPAAGAADKLGAASIALVGGLAVALFAL